MDCKGELYPREKEKQWQYRFSAVGYTPSKVEAFKLYCLIQKIMGKKKSDKQFMNEFNLDKGAPEDLRVKEALRSVFAKDDNLKNHEWLKAIKIDVVKGSMYEIKKYLFENNNLTQIRGASTIIDYLNNEGIVEVLKNQGLDETNIIYRGGGEALVVAPLAYGSKLCKDFEDRFKEVALSISSAFETVEATLFDLLFDFHRVSMAINNAVDQRKGIKLYEVNPESDCKGIRVMGNDISFRDHDKSKLTKAGVRVCDFCDFREGKYFLKVNGGEDSICPSCLRKYDAGKMKEVFEREFEQFTSNRYKVENKITSIDKLGKEIAVIYANGNGIGEVLKDAANVYEVMYFSRRIEEVIKKSFYNSINEVMGQGSKFEVINIVGDELFFIIPADYAFDVSIKLVEKFQGEFNNEITLSLGCVIAKKDAPLFSLFKGAEKNLKRAKQLMCKTGLKEGSIDITEITGGWHFSEGASNRLFPMKVSQLRKTVEDVRRYRDSFKQLNQLYKMSYAHKNMEEEEFNLFYFYSDAKAKSNNGMRIDELIKTIYGNGETRAVPYKIPWDDIITIRKRV